VVLVTNGSARYARRPALRAAVVVAEGADKADDWIAEAARPVDICLTADIPWRPLHRQRAFALSFKGVPWTTDNIGSALAGREVARHLREMGMAGGGRRR